MYIHTYIHTYTLYTYIYIYIYTYPLGPPASPKFDMGLHHPPKGGSMHLSSKRRGDLSKRSGDLSQEVSAEVIRASVRKR